MRRRLFITLILLSFLYTNSVYACRFDSDCSLGSQCAKSSGSLYGYCINGQKPGNRFDRQPAYNSSDLTGHQGQTCSFSTDCGAGGTCVKGNGIYGVCL